MAALPVSIPGGCGSISLPPSRNTSCATLSGSYIGSVMATAAAGGGGMRRPSLTPPSALSAETEKKINRTRRASEAVRVGSATGAAAARSSAASSSSSLATSRPMSPRARIPTEVGDLTKEWARLMVNQFLLKHDRPLLAKADSIVEFEVTNCKASVGEFSCTYQINILLDRSREGPSPNSSSSSVTRDPSCAAAAEEGEDDDRSRFSLIAKLLPADDANRAYVFEANLLEKEIEMYFEVLPSVCSFLRAQPEGDLSRVLQRVIPECVYGSHNSDGAGILVFRSVRDWGFQHCCSDDAGDGLSAPELRLAASSLGAMHAVGVALLAKNTADKVQRRYPYLTQDMYGSSVHQHEARQHLRTYQELLNSGPDEELLEPREIFSRLRAVADERDRRGSGEAPGRGLAMLRGLRRQGPPTLNTLVHGELWENNIMFRPSDDRCLFLDWKNAKIASGTLDLAFLLFSSCSAELIWRTLPSVLSAYRDSLCATLRRLEPRCAGPTAEELLADFELSLPDALLQAVCMFVREMQFLEEGTVGADGRVVRETVDRLHVYERRAMNLLKVVEVVEGGDVVDGEREPLLRLRVKHSGACDTSHHEGRRQQQRRRRESGDREGLPAGFTIGDEDEEE